MMGSRAAAPAAVTQLWLEHARRRAQGSREAAAAAAASSRMSQHHQVHRDPLRLAFAQLDRRGEGEVGRPCNIRREGRAIPCNIRRSLVILEGREGIPL